MSSMSGIWRCSLQSRGVFWHPRVASVLGRHRSDSPNSKCGVDSIGRRNTHIHIHQLHFVGCLQKTPSGKLYKDAEYANLNQEGNLPKCQNSHEKLFSKLGKDTYSKHIPPRHIHKIGATVKRSTLLPNTYSTHLNTTFLLWSQAPTLSCSLGFIRTFSSQPEDPGLQDQIKTDPELKAWLQEISKDFTSTPKPAAGADEKQGSSPSSDSSNSDSDSSSSSSDSSSSSSDSSSSDSDSSDSESDVKSVKSLHASGPSAQLHTNPLTPPLLDPLTRVDLAGAALSDTNVDGSVHEEDDLEEEEEYEDFYHDFEDEDEEMPQRHLPISLERGTSGVYDIDELVTLLRDENARDICVISVPADYKYVDHMVVVTGRSTRHLIAMAELVRWVYKRKRSRRDPKTVKIEGEQTKDWMALDLGNIAVHLFLEEARAKYDLETLWTVGADFDSKSQEEDVDPFALFVDQAWTGLRPEAEQEPAAAPPAQTPASMDSLTGWHGGPHSNTR